MKCKCMVCGEELKTTFLDKIAGTCVKVGKGEDSRSVYVCSGCQKEHKEDLKEKVKNSGK